MATNLTLEEVKLTDDLLAGYMALGTLRERYSQESFTTLSPETARRAAATMGAVETAQQAVFTALNIASSHGANPMAERFMDKFFQRGEFSEVKIENCHFKQTITEQE